MTRDMLLRVIKRRRRTLMTSSTLPRGQGASEKFKVIQRNQALILDWVIDLLATKEEHHTEGQR